MAIDQAEFRHVLGHFASGVTVVTACQAGTCHGITVSAFTSLSLEPPLVLLCIDQRSSWHDIVASAGTFVVNILAEDGAWLSQLFASRDPDKFTKVGYHIGRAGAPMLDEALAVLECRLHNQLPGGDHTIFVGEVIATEVRRKTKPLLYFRSGYHGLA